MRHLFWGLVVITVLALAGPAAAFELSSPDMIEGGNLADRQVLSGFGCAGANVSPALAWTNPPAGTKSYALTVYDPDAPTGSGWWHWVVINLPAGTTTLPAGAGGGEGNGLPPGAVQSRTDFGQPGYGGACPPAGDAPHRYVFTVHALDAAHLDLPTEASAAMVGFVLGRHRLGQATLTARYGR